MWQLRKLGHLTGYRLQAKDGEIGKLKQIYFDDKHWVVRYFVVHTGNWLLGRDVLIAPSVVTAVNEENKRLDVDLTCDQIRNSPPKDDALPVSRHYEQEYYHYYGWEPYWIGDPMLGSAPVIPPSAEAIEPKEPENPHLRSTDKVVSYHIHARDSEFGHVEDFIVEDSSWTIRYLEIDIRNWLPGKKVLISPTWIQHVDWHKHEVTVNLNAESIQKAPAYDSSKVISQEYQVKLFKHYGMQYEEG